MEFIIKPYQSVGELSFGNSREKCREQLGTDELILRSDGNLPIDHYEKEGIFAIYDKYNNFAAMEIKRPSKPIFKGKNLMRLSWDEALIWFKSLDPEVEVTHKEFVSWKYGIAFYAPAKDQKPETLAKTITVFQENFFYVKDGIPNPDDITSFHLQPGYVEGLEKKNKSFESITEAFRDIFQNNGEYVIFHWNSVPVRFNYTFDLPEILPSLVPLLNEINATKSGNAIVSFSCISFACKWQVTWSEEVVKINADWERVEGDYTEALNNYSEMSMLRKEFLSEWKMLLQQCHSAFKASGATISNTEEAEIIDTIKQVERRIQNFGKFYHDPDPSVVTKNADGRIEVDLNHLSKGFKWLLGTGIIVGVFFLSWYLMRHMGNPFWMLEALIPVLMYTFGIGIPLVALVLLYLRYRERR